MLPLPIQEAILRLSPEAQEVITLIVSVYESENQKLREEIQGLKEQLGKNSSNSSKPPSSDSPFKERLKSSQKKRTRKPGGQKGHEGSTLKMVSAPDQVVAHRLESCSKCGTSLQGVAVIGHQRRQSYDIPAIQIAVTEHQAEVKCCCGCGSVVSAEFPSHVSGSVQYGPNLKSLLTYWQNYQMLPYERTVEMVRDLTGHSLSSGTLYNTQKKVYASLAGFEAALIDQLSKADLAHFDETGVNLSGSLGWVHLCTTQSHAHFGAHPKRGREAMDEIGILSKFEGTAVHDFWKSYFDYAHQHAMCNAHLLRELKAVADFSGQDWAGKMADLLRTIKKSVDKAKERGQSELAKNVRSRFENQYDHFLQDGFQLNPLPPPTGKRGRPAKPKPLNLLERFREWKEAILRFMYEFDVPFDNNLAERNLRMLKVKMKVSGCFRSPLGLAYFMRIRSFIVTARMQGLTAFQALKELFVNPIEIQYQLIFSPPLP